METIWETLQADTATGSPQEALARLLLCLCLVTVVAFLYHSNYRGYGRAAQQIVVLILTSLTTCGIIMAIGTNLALSLGMVGALSIVRFRTAVKDTRDLAYIFLALALGLICGSGATWLALVLLGVVGVVSVVVERIARRGLTSRGYVILLARTQGTTPADALRKSLQTAEFKSSVFQRDTSTEESTYRAIFPDAASVERFRQAAQADEGITSYQLLGPEDAIAG